MSSTAALRSKLIDLLPEHEIDAVINALTAGATPEEMHSLVNQLHAARGQ